jgi:oligopeptide transport system substrate-binding protein
MLSVLTKGVALLLMIGTFFSGGTPAPQSPAPAPTETVIRYPLTEEFVTLDPALLTDVNSQVGATHLFEGLVRMTAAGPVPGMAERWEVLADGTQYRFYLRDGLRWSNGDPLTADDFVYAWTRVLDPKLAAGYAFDLYPLKGGEAFNNVDPRNPAQYDAAKSALGVKALDARTLEVTLEAPAPYFLGLTGYTTYLPVPKRLVERDPSAWANRPESLVSNGPFKLATWERGKQATMIKNPYYWNRAAVKVDRLLFPVVYDPGTAVAMFEAGELDAARVSPYAKVGQIPERQRSAGPIFTSYYYLFNTTVKPFDDPRVRRALALSLDRKELLAALHAENRPLYAVVPGGAPDALPGSDFRTVGGDLFHEDLAEARRLLAEAGYPNGQSFPAVELTFNIGEIHQSIAEIAIATWRQNLGITSIKAVPVEFKALLDRRMKGAFTLARGGWSGDYPDAMSFLDLWVTGGALNDAGYANPEFDGLIKRAKSTDDQQVRLQAMHEAESLLIRDMPVLPLYESMNTYLQSPKVTGLYWDPRGGVDFTFAQITQ